MSRARSFPELYILRHGQTEWNAQGRVQGRLNSPLTAKGVAQARAQGAIMAQHMAGFDIISSPQIRALHTALLAFASPQAAMIRTDDRLCEIDVGRFQGRLHCELELQGDLRLTEDGPLALYEQAEGGEGFAALRVRCLDFLEDLTGPSIVVTHGMTSRMLRALLLGYPLDALDRLPGGQGVVFHVHGGVQRLLRAE